MASSAARDMADLLRCDQRIADGEKQIAEQEARLARLSSDGRNVALFQLLLTLFRDTLQVERGRRALIAERISRRDATKAAPKPAQMTQRAA